MRPKYLDWLTYEEQVITSEGKQISVYELVAEDDEVILNEWAKHLREHYCSDSEIDDLRKGLGLSRSEYLLNIKFPDKKGTPGPSIRSGDFTEILVADYVQYLLDYIVPRTRYDRKINRNSSPMGSDLVGYKCGEKVSETDELIVFEVKSSASEKAPSQPTKLQKAINDSNKDVVRLAETLNAIYQRLKDRSDNKTAKQIQRFQNSTDNPYKTIYSAAAVYSNKSYSVDHLKDISTADHCDPDVKLLVIHSDKLMAFIHDMYERASKC